MPPTTGVFLFEDHRIACASFLLPDNCRKVSTRAFLTFLAQRGLIESAADIECLHCSGGPSVFDTQISAMTVTPDTLSPKWRLYASSALSGQWVLRLPQFLRCRCAR